MTSQLIDRMLQLLDDYERVLDGGKAARPAGLASFQKEAHRYIASAVDAREEIRDVRSELLVARDEPGIQ